MSTATNYLSKLCYIQIWAFPTLEEPFSDSDIPIDEPYDKDDNSDAKSSVSDSSFPRSMDADTSGESSFDEEILIGEPFETFDLDSDELPTLCDDDSSLILVQQFSWYQQGSFYYYSVLLCCRKIINCPHHMREH